MVLSAAGPWPATEVSSIRTLAACVATGQGLALVPEVAVAEELARAALVRIPWLPPGAGACAVWMGWAAGTAAAEVATAVEVLRETSRNRPPRSSREAREVHARG